MALYMDVHVRRAITEALRVRGVDALTAQADGSARLSDAQLLNRARALNRVLFTHDTDLLAEAAQRQQTGEPFAGLIYAHPLRISLQQCIADLVLLAQATDPRDWCNHVEFLPLR